MADTGWLYPTGTGDPLDEWKNGVNLKADDGNKATQDTVGKKEDTDTYDFETHIPRGADIDGIEVEVEAQVDNWLGFGPETAVLGVALSRDGGSIYSTELPYGFVGSGPGRPAPPEVHVYGSPTYKWLKIGPPPQVPLTAKALWNATFRARIRFVSSSDHNIDFAGGGGVDYVKVKVHYTPIKTRCVDGACVRSTDHTATVG